MHRGRRVARLRVQRRGGEENAREHAETTKRHDREATEREKTNGAGQPAGPLADRSAGRNGRCVFCVYARGAMIRVYHSHGVYRATTRGIAREGGREAGRCKGDRWSQIREREKEREGEGGEREGRDGEKEKMRARKENPKGEGNRRRAGG